MRCFSQADVVRKANIGVALGEHKKRVRPNGNQMTVAAKHVHVYAIDVLYAHGCISGSNRNWLSCNMFDYLTILCRQGMSFEQTLLACCGFPEIDGLEVSGRDAVRPVLNMWRG